MSRASLTAQIAQLEHQLTANETAARAIRKFGTSGAITAASINDAAEQICRRLYALRQQLAGAPLVKANA